MDLLAKGLAFDELHCDKVSAVVLADFIYVRNVRVAQGSSSFGFLNKATHPLSIRSDIRREKLQSDRTL
jgi:hypothetical protein